MDMPRSKTPPDVLPLEAATPTSVAPLRIRPDFDKNIEPAEMHRLRRKFPKGQRVHYYDAVLAPNRRFDKGTVVGYRADGRIWVYMDGSYQTPYPFRPEALKRLRKKG